MQRFLIFITVLGTLWLCACQKTEPEELRFQPSPSVPEAGTVPLQLSFGVVEQRIVDTDDPYDDTIPKTRVVNGRPDNVNLYIFNETAEYAYHAYLTKVVVAADGSRTQRSVPDLLHRQSGVRHGGTDTRTTDTVLLPGGRS